MTAAASIPATRAAITVPYKIAPVVHLPRRLPNLMQSLPSSCHSRSLCRFTPSRLLPLTHQKTSRPAHIRLTAGLPLPLRLLPRQTIQVCVIHHFKLPWLVLCYRVLVRFLGYYGGTAVPEQVKFPSLHADGRYPSPRPHQRISFLLFPFHALLLLVLRVS